MALPPFIHAVVIRSCSLPQLCAAEYARRPRRPADLADIRQRQSGGGHPQLPHRCIAPESSWCTAAGLPSLRTRGAALFPPFVVEYDVWWMVVVVVER
eukprot:2828863-Prymnesium_polylepis.1